MFSNDPQPDLNLYSTVADLPEDLFDLYQLAKLLVDIQNTSVDDVLLEKDTTTDDR